jgi:hypothetical protein
MANNHIEVYEKNTKVIAVYVCGLPDLSLFTPYLTVKRKATDSSTLLTATGVISDPSTTFAFTLTPTDTSIAPGDYCFDITLDGSSGRYTIVKDTFSILNSVKD